MWERKGGGIDSVEDDTCEMHLILMGEAELFTVVADPPSTELVHKGYAVKLPEVRK